MAEATPKAARKPALPDAAPAAIKLKASYAGFSEDGERFAFDEGHVVHDPKWIAYFVAREGALFEAV